MLMVIVFLSPQQTPVQWWLIPSRGGFRNPVWQRIFWAALIGISAITLLLAGGLSSITNCHHCQLLPFAIVLLASIYGLIKALRVDVYKRIARQMTTIAPPASRNPIPWQRRLRNIALFS